MKNGILILLVLCCLLPACKKKGLKNCCNTGFIETSYKDNFIYIPNAFTPNGDGLNDAFYAYVSCDNNTANCSSAALTAIDMTIKNKRGKVVFKELNNTALNANWNGGTENAGVYSYAVTLYFSDGTSKTYNGQVCNNGTGKIPCDNYNDCRFGSNFDGEGFNANLISGEVFSCD